MKARPVSAPLCPTRKIDSRKVTVPPLTPPHSRNEIASHSRRLCGYSSSSLPFCFSLILLFTQSVLFFFSFFNVYSKICQNFKLFKIFTVIVDFSRFCFLSLFSLIILIILLLLFAASQSLSNQSCRPRVASPQQCTTATLHHCSVEACRGRRAAGGVPQ